MGWEPDRFYREWASFPLSKADLEELRGPALVRLASQSDEAPELLDRFRSLLRDPAYAARIRRHCRAFRELVGPSPTSPTPSRPADRARRRQRSRAKRRRG